MATYSVAVIGLACLTVSAGPPAGRRLTQTRLRGRQRVYLRRAVERGWHGHFNAMLNSPDPKVQAAGINDLRKYLSTGNAWRVMAKVIDLVSFTSRRPGVLPADIEQLARRKVTDALRDKTVLARITGPDAWIYRHGNFNWPLTICAWAILGGQFADNREVEQAGVHNLEELARKLHVVGPGTPGEYNSPHYQSIAQLDLAAIVNFSRRPDARLLAEVLLERLYVDLVSRYHAPSQQLGGPFSRSYAHTDTGALNIALFPLVMRADRPPFFDDLAAGEVGGFATTGAIPRALYLVEPFAPYLLTIAERKPLPYTIVNQTCCSDYYRGVGEEKDVWPASASHMTCHLTREYALASGSRPYVDDGHGKVLVAQWRRAEHIRSMQDFRTLYTHYTFNERCPVTQTTYLGWTPKPKTIGITFWHNDGRGMITQHKGKAVVMYHPKTFEARYVHSMKLDVAVPIYAPLGELAVNDRKVTRFPVMADFSDLVFIRDHRTYVAIRPLVPRRLGGARKVMLSMVDSQKQTRWNAKPENALKKHLLVSIYNYHDPTGQLKPLAKRGGDPRFRLNYNGLILELATVDEFPTLAAFRRHIRAAKVTDELLPAKPAKGDVPRAPKEVRRVTYTSGPDTLTMAYRLTTEQVLEQTVNGRPVKPDLYESPWCRQTRSGQVTLGRTTCRLTKGIAVTVVAIDSARQYAVLNVDKRPTRVALKTPYGTLQTERFGRGVLRCYPGPGGTQIEIRSRAIPAPIEWVGLPEPARVVWNGTDVSAQVKRAAPARCELPCAQPAW